MKPNSSFMPKTTSMGSAFLMPNTKFFTQNNWSSKISTSSYQNTSKAPIPTTNTSSVTSSGNSSQYKKLTAGEHKARREKGLCYYCDDKYSPSHKCKSSCLLLVGQDEIDELLKDDELEETQTSEEAENEINIMEVNAGISLNAFVGQFHPSALWVTGLCTGKEINFFVDNGSNNNFIKASIAAKLKLPQISISKFKVGTGSGVYLQCDRKCKGVKLKIQGHEFLTDLYVLEIKGSDVVLGVQWLIELDTIKTNYKDLWMRFNYGGKEIEIQGENLLGPNPLKSKSLNKMLVSYSISGFYHMQVMTDLGSSERSSTPEPINLLIQRFQRIFEEPKSLPPAREVDHRIPIESIRPYRYPHFQKTEIEKPVGEMLSTGVIRDIQSPFSSPVLLVKKKDGSWRFCVDYMGLNGITVKDKFPIPTIDEIWMS